MLVLWIVALLTIVAVAMTAAQRTESALAANQMDSARFRALADAAIQYAALNLMALPPLEAQDEYDLDLSLWTPDGEPRAWRFDGETLEIRLTNEASLIDLNQAPRELLAGLLLAVGVPVEEQDPLLDAILDWRDEDDLHLLNGAEDADYEDAGRPYGAKDGPFDSVEELQQVLGFDRDLYRRVAPALTVSSGGGSVVEELAPPLVRAAIAGLTLEELEERMAVEEEAEALAGEPPALNRGGPLYRARVTAALSGRARRSMEALFAVEPTGPTPAAVLWRRFSLGDGDGASPEEGSGVD
jgi:general secretion pathway protein K